jgi:hypothetical protein
MPAKGPSTPPPRAPSPPYRPAGGDVDSTGPLPRPDQLGRQWIRRRRLWMVGAIALVVIATVAVVAATWDRSPGSKSVDASGQQSPISAIQPPIGSSIPTPSASSKSASPSASQPSGGPATKKATPTKKGNEPPVTGTTIPDRPNCAPNPSSCGLPDAGNTGVPAGTKLTVVNGDMTVSKAGSVVQNKDIRGCVDVDAPNVTIRDSKISCTDYYGVSSFTSSYKGGGLLIEDTEIDCMDHNTTGVGSYGVTARRLNIHGCENGFDVDSDVTVEDSYIHDLYEGATGHADGVQLSEGINVVVQHNTIFNPGGTSAMISNGKNISNVLVSNNLLAGGAYTLYCPSISSSDYRVIGNRFSKLFSSHGGEYGAMNDCNGNVAQVSGNLWDDDLKPVSTD